MAPHRRLPPLLITAVARSSPRVCCFHTARHRLPRMCSVHIRRRHHSVAARRLLFSSCWALLALHTQRCTAFSPLVIRHAHLRASAFRVAARWRATPHIPLHHFTRHCIPPRPSPHFHALHHRIPLHHIIPHRTPPRPSPRRRTTLIFISAPHRAPLHFAVSFFAHIYRTSGFPSLHFITPLHCRPLHRTPRCSVSPPALRAIALRLTAPRTVALHAATAHCPP